MRVGVKVAQVVHTHWDTGQYRDPQPGRSEKSPLQGLNLATITLSAVLTYGKTGKM